jgi:hypothetical protein
MKIKSAVVIVAVAAFPISRPHRAALSGVGLDIFSRSIAFPPAAVGPCKTAARRSTPPYGRWEIGCGQEGGRQQRIADALNAEKAPTRTGAKWSKMTVKAVLEQTVGK